MPPRIQNQLASNSLLPFLSSTSTPSTSSSASLSKLPISQYSPSSSCSSRRSSRPFSSTASTQTKLRNEMFTWLKKEGEALKNHTPGSTNYLSALRFRGEEGQRPPSWPFPLNPSFVSEPVLSEELRNDIYERVVVKKKSVRAVSVELGVDMRRVGAVVRLVELEKRMKQQGKSMALPYARAIHEMIPTTPLHDDARGHRFKPHEAINDLPVHRLTETQIFYPVSESRQFNRVDAGRVFSAAPAQEHTQVARNASDPAAAVSRVTQQPSTIETVGKGADETQVLQAADMRIPHPHLVAHQRHRLEKPNEAREAQDLYKKRLKVEETAEKERKRISKERAEQKLLKVQPEASRFEFRFKDVEVSRETVGKDGRGSKAPGHRYGVPSYDRKKGQVKIPTRVEV
ncbi:hypothetical protein FE257_008955 [Aspergillus nanangensis]|uniref:Eukaryotic mitochondrial regulator protein-domain-containing protein n=1 Tax=Aspergillus nanangensis TaxID=2582783 RepID=A0AAD4GXM8_ASPNN|nr:hypothetical protein FE257_008955 [Aspergillus nanangensis]